MSRTRAEVRRWAGRLSGQLLLCTATAAGTTQTFTDQDKLAGGNLGGREAYLAEGTAANLGQTRSVASHDKNSGTLTFGRTLPAATAVGDVVELWNERDLGNTVDQVHQAMADYIDAVADLALVPVIDDSQSFDLTSPVLDLPADWRGFSGADWQDPTGVWRPFGNADVKLDVAGRQVRLVGVATRRANGYAVRLRGAARPSAPTRDDDVVPIDAEYLAFKIAAELLFAANRKRTTTDAQQAGALAQNYQAYAESRAPKLRSQYQGRLVLLP